MNEPTLQNTLREKYSIDELLMAEGRFVVLLGDHAANLVCLGLGRKFLVIARVVFSENELDYDLISLLPLSAICVAFQETQKKLKIRSQFRATQVFQLCTCANQAEIWDNFTSTIREVYRPEQGDIWLSPTLQPPAKLDSRRQSPQELKPSNSSIIHNSNNSLHSASSSRSFPDSQQSFSLTILSESCISHQTNLSSRAEDTYSFSQSFPVSQQSCTVISESSVSLPTNLPSRADDTYSFRQSFPVSQKSCTVLSESCISLPTNLPSRAEDTYSFRQVSPRSHSLNFLDELKFDNFVNDAPTRFSEYSEHYVPCAWTGSADDIVKLSNEELNTPNNFLCSASVSANQELNKTCDNVTDDAKEDRKVKGLFKRLVACCKSDKKTND